jgi:hypothetical protein
MMHMFSITKVQPDGEVEFIVTVKEYVTPKAPADGARLCWKRFPNA